VPSEEYCDWLRALLSTSCPEANHSVPNLVVPIGRVRLWAFVTDRIR
jgi:hypothetical protein